MDINSLALSPASRSLLVGTTGSGKSTLAETLLPLFQRQHPNARILILDSKPRFRAEWEIRGTKAAGRYKKWGYGAPYPGSFRLPLAGNLKAEMDAVWSAGGHVAIAQVEHMDAWPVLSQALDVFYEAYGAKITRFVYVDELMDFFQYKQIGKRSITRVLRSGRERNIGLLAATQRPKWVPREVLTELSTLYLFQLDSRDDVKALHDNMGLPETAPMPEAEHSFLYYDKRLRGRAPSGAVYKLARG